MLRTHANIFSSNFFLGDLCPEPRCIAAPTGQPENSHEQVLTGVGSPEDPQFQGTASEPLIYYLYEPRIQLCGSLVGKTTQDSSETSLKVEVVNFSLAETMYINSLDWDKIMALLCSSSTTTVQINQYLQPCRVTYGSTQWVDLHRHPQFIFHFCILSNSFL